jgi:hypothetical protein
VCPSLRVGIDGDHILGQITASDAITIRAEQPEIPVSITNDDPPQRSADGAGLPIGKGIEYFNGAGHLTNGVPRCLGSSSNWSTRASSSSAYAFSLSAVS